MEQIAEFAELGEFFDQPLGVYSSGMRIRLAFSMFAFLECDVLILDEVLAVGDIFFKQKCYGRLEELIAHNTAIILVTHSTGTVRRYCDDVIVLDKGKILFHGPSTEAIPKYFEIKKDQGVKISVADTHIEEDYVNYSNGQLLASSDKIDWPAESDQDMTALPQKSKSKWANLINLSVRDERGNPCQVFNQGATACIYFAYQVKENMGIPVTEINLVTVNNLLVHSKNSIQIKANHPRNVKAGDIIRYKQHIKLDLAPGNYIFNLGLYSMHPSDFDDKEKFSSAELKEKLINVIRVKPAGAIEVISETHNKVIGLHGGLCNLEGEIHTQVIPAH